MSQAANVVESKVQQLSVLVYVDRAEFDKAVGQEGSTILDFSDLKFYEQDCRRLERLGYIKLNFFAEEPSRDSFNVEEFDCFDTVLQETQVDVAAEFSDDIEGAEDLECELYSYTIKGTPEYVDALEA